MTAVVSAVPGALAVPADAPGWTVLTLGVLGLIIGAALTGVREMHRHSEDQLAEAHRHSEDQLAEAHRHAEIVKTLDGAVDVDAAAVVAALRGISAGRTAEHQGVIAPGRRRSAKT